VLVESREKIFLRSHNETFEIHTSLKKEILIVEQLSNFFLFPLSHPHLPSKQKALSSNPST
jgi:hypothetical protein